MKCFLEFAVEKSAELWSNYNRKKDSGRSSRAVTVPLLWWRQHEISVDIITKRRRGDKVMIKPKEKAQALQHSCAFVTFPSLSIIHNDHHAPDNTNLGRKTESSFHQMCKKHPIWHRMSGRQDLLDKQRSSRKGNGEEKQLMWTQINICCTRLWHFMEENSPFGDTHWKKWFLELPK